MSPRLIAALFLIAAVVAFRLLPIFASEELSKALANISPLAALALCGAMLLPRGWALPVTFSAFFISDVALNVHYGSPLISGYTYVLLAAFAAVFAIGWVLRKKPTLTTALAGALGGTLLFYIVTNTASFFFDPGYTKSLGGWLQALTVGLPTYVPTWAFGLRSLAGNLVFAALFYFAIRPLPTRDGHLATTPATSIS